MGGENLQNLSEKRGRELALPSAAKGRHTQIDEKITFVKGGLLTSNTEGGDNGKAAFIACSEKKKTSLKLGWANKESHSERCNGHWHRRRRKNGRRPYTPYALGKKVVGGVFLKEERSREERPDPSAQPLMGGEGNSRQKGRTGGEGKQLKEES